MPLTDATVSILEVLPRRSDNPYLFPGTRYNRPLSSMALLLLMRSLGYGANGDRGDYVPHGFRRNTLGHELARRVIGRGSEVDRTKAANRFAGAFLVPREHLRAKVGNKRKVLQYDNLIRLKHLYRVSGACLLVRIQQVGILRKLRMFRVFEKGLRAWSAFEPEPLDDQGSQEKPKRFERLCRQSLDERLISPQTASELLDLPAKGAR